MFKSINNERGVVGLAFLSLVLIVALFGAGYYVYQVRQGNPTTVTSVLIPSSANLARKAPAVVKNDPDAKAADVAGAKADDENLNDENVSAADLQ